MQKTQYGPVLGKIRRDKNIKAEIVAKNLGISTTTYSQIEQGYRSASFERVVGICGELGLSLRQLTEELNIMSKERLN